MSELFAFGNLTEKPKQRSINMETPELKPVVAEPVEKPKKQMTPAQLESLAKAREKALEVRRAKAAAKKAEVENPPDLAPVYHGEEPPKPEPPVQPTIPEETVPVDQSTDSESDDGVEAEVQRRVKAIKNKYKEKKAKKRETRKRYVIEESESSEEEGEILLVRKKPRARKVAAPDPPTMRPSPYQYRGPHPGSAFGRY